MMANIIFVVDGSKMKSYNITIDDPFVQKWFNYLYDQGRLGATVERITKYYIDCILQSDEEEPKEYCAVKTKKNSFISRTLKKFDRKPKEPKIKFSLDDIILANGPLLEK
jgi:hypothetical protein